MKTKHSAGVASTCLKNAQFAKSSCSVPKNEYLSDIDHSVHKEKHIVSFTRIHQLENLKTNKNWAPKLILCTFSFLYLMIFKFSIFIRGEG